MTEKEQRHKVRLLLIAGVLIILAFILHNSKAEARNCHIVTEAYPKLQLSMVSKVCWETSPKVAKSINDRLTMEAPTIVPRVKPLIQIAPVAETKKKNVQNVQNVQIAKKRNSACGSRRQVWRTLKGGHRKYRCK